MERWISKTEAPVFITIVSFHPKVESRTMENQMTNISKWCSSSYLYLQSWKTLLQCWNWSLGTLNLSATALKRMGLPFSPFQLSVRSYLIQRCEENFAEMYNGSNSWGFVIWSLCPMLHWLHFLCPPHLEQGKDLMHH